MKLAFRNSFLKIVKKLKDDNLKVALNEAIVRCRESKNLNDINNIKKLKGYSNSYRLRVGMYRVGLNWDEKEQTLYFVTFLHRKDIYKRFP